MLKNDLLKNDGEIIRIITIKNNQALVIDFDIFTEKQKNYKHIIFPEMELKIIKKIIVRY